VLAPARAVVAMTPTYCNHLVNFGLATPKSSSFWPISAFFLVKRWPVLAISFLSDTKFKNPAWPPADRREKCTKYRRETPKNHNEPVRAPSFQRKQPSLLIRAAKPPSPPHASIRQRVPRPKACKQHAYSLELPPKSTRNTRNTGSRANQSE